MSIEFRSNEFLPTPKIDREYIEIYPVNWTEMSGSEIKDVFTSRSNEKISEISLYFHIPFCPALCPFCKFNITEYNDSTYKEYVNALRSEISLYKEHPDLDGRKVTAIYFGGGTGSMLKPKDMTSVLEDVIQVFPLSKDVETTVECHPNTVGKKRFKEYFDIGINRVSLGVQSFQNKNLASISRNHTAERNVEVLTAALDTGFKAVAIDLMYRLPNQTPKNLLYDLEKVREFRPHGVSVYSLGIEGTKLNNKVPEIATDEVDKQFFYYIGDFLKANGYGQFMQPDFSLQSKECKYVVNAWRAPQQLMLAFGAGANTHYFGDHNWTNIYPVSEYIGAIKKGLAPIALGTRVTERELMSKYMVLGVRAIGVSKGKFEDLFGISIQDAFQKEISYLIRLGWIKDNGEEYRLTRDGLYYADNMCKLFYSEANLKERQPRGKNLYTFVPKNFYDKKGQK